MKKHLYFLIIISFFLHMSTAFAVHSKKDNMCEPEIKTAPSVDLTDRAQVEMQLGRKLKFKERIALSLLHSKIKKDKKNSDQGNTPAERAGMDGFAIAGFVLGIVSLFFAGILLGILAIVFSAIGMGRIEKSGGQGKGFAIAGLILGIVGVVGAVIVLAGA